MPGGKGSLRSCTHNFNEITLGQFDVGFFARGQRRKVTEGRIDANGGGVGDALEEEARRKRKCKFWEQTEQEKRR